MSEPKYYKLFKEFAAQRDIPAAAKIVLAVITDRIGDNDHAWPGIRKLAEDTGQDISTVLRSIKKLEDVGRLKVERQGKGKSNHYYLAEDESVGRIQAPAKCKRWQNANTGVGKMPTEALAKRKHNQTDPLNQPNYTRPNSEEYRLANVLFECIQERKKDFLQPNLVAWAKQIDYMIRLDHRKPERIEQVIRWVQQDAGNGGNWRGWQDNILSTAKLRDKFDQLELQMGKGKGKSKPSRDFSEQESKVGTVITNESFVR